MQKVFSLPIRVYFEDTDAGGIVYHANYLRFFERARTEMLREMGFAQKDLAEKTGVLFVVVSADTVFKRPALLDDELTVETRLTSLRPASAVFTQQVLRAGEPIATAQVRIATVSAAAKRPVAFPEGIRNCFENVLFTESLQ